MGRLLRLMVALVVLSTGAADALAQTPSDTDRAAARSMGEEALVAYRAGEFAKALDLFERAHAVVGLSTTGLYIARCLVQLGRFVEASERYVEVTRMVLPEDALPIHVEAVATARDEREKLLPRISQLTLSVDDGAEVVVTLDGVTVPPALLGVARPVDPGEHRVVVTRGDQTHEDRVQLAEGEKRSLMLELDRATPAPTPAPAPVRPPEDDGMLLQTFGWIAIGLGGASLVLGAVTGGLALDKRSSLETACLNKECAPPFHSDVDTYQTLRVVSGVGLIAGGVLAAAGVVMVIISPSPTTADPVLALGVAPGHLTLSGSF